MLVGKISQIVYILILISTDTLTVKKGLQMYKEDEERQVKEASHFVSVIVSLAGTVSMRLQSELFDYNSNIGNVGR